MPGVKYGYTQLNPRVPGSGIWAQIPILIPKRVGYSGMSTTGVLNPEQDPGSHHYLDCLDHRTKNSRTQTVKVKQEFFYGADIFHLLLVSSALKPSTGNLKIVNEP